MLNINKIWLIFLRVDSVKYTAKVLLHILLQNIRRQLFTDFIHFLRESGEFL